MGLRTYVICFTDCKTPLGKLLFVIHSGTYREQNWETELKFGENGVKNLFLLIKESDLMSRNQFLISRTEASWMTWRLLLAVLLSSFFVFYFLYSAVIKCVPHKVWLWVNVQTNTAASVSCELMFPVCSTARTDRQKDVKHCRVSSSSERLSEESSPVSLRKRLIIPPSACLSVCLSVCRETDRSHMEDSSFLFFLWLCQPRTGEETSPSSLPLCRKVTARLIGINQLAAPVEWRHRDLKRNGIDPKREGVYRPGAGACINSSSSA